MMKIKTQLNFIIMIVSLGGLLFGYDIGVIAGTLNYLKAEFNFTNEQLEFIVGAVFVGSLIGSLIAGVVADYLGRKPAVMIISLLFLIGTYFAMTANSFITLFIARIFLGCGAGFIAVVIPLYIVEITPYHCRGKCLAWFQTLLTIGILLAYCVDYLYTFTHDWRAMFSFLFIPSSLLFLLHFILPETPRWLIINNRNEHAKRILEKMRTSEETESTEKEYQTILRSTETEINNLNRGSWKE